jgi:hypothetical protein
MKTITLSDHTGSQVQRLRDARTAEPRAKWSRYQEQLNEFNECRAGIKKSLKDAMVNRKPWQFTTALFQWITVGKRPVPPVLMYRPPSDQECAFVAGNEGEALVLSALESSLGDEWTVIRGYKNNKGETDLIAIGPAGIAALEVKHLNAVVHCHQDRWWKDKYDNYGNLVEQGGAIEDNGGRSPSRQVNEAADALEAYLAKRGLAYRIIRVVVLSSPKSAYGSMSEVTVDCIRKLEDLNLLSACSLGGYKLSSARVERIASLIQQDHDFHFAHRKRKKEQLQAIPV